MVVLLVVFYVANIFLCIPTIGHTCFHDYDPKELQKRTLVLNYYGRNYVHNLAVCYICIGLMQKYPPIF